VAGTQRHLPEVGIERRNLDKPRNSHGPCYGDYLMRCAAGSWTFSMSGESIGDHFVFGGNSEATGLRSL